MKLSPRVKQNLRKILPKSLIVFRAELKRRKINLEDFSKSTIAEVKINAEKICGSEADGSKPGWNYYSDALLPEVIQTFESAILALNSQFTKVNYLEIGSNQGLSMSAISLMLKSQGILGELVSVDPYFEEGYKEGNLTPELGTYKVNINKSTKELALNCIKH
jgi:hypothetical protein